MSSISHILKNAILWMKFIALVILVIIIGCWEWDGPWFNIKMSSYQYRKTHCGDKMVLRSFYLHNGISYTGKMSSLYCIGAWWSFIWIFLLHHHFLMLILKWGLWYQKQVTQTGKKTIATYSTLWDAITYPCLRNLLLVPKSSYNILTHWSRDKMDANAFSFMKMS